MNEPSFEEDFIHQEGVLVEDTYESDLEFQVEILMASKFQLNFQNYEFISSHSFERQLASHKTSPTILKTEIWPEYVSKLNAITAIEDLGKKKTKGFFINEEI